MINIRVKYAFYELPCGNVWKCHVAACRCSHMCIRVCVCVCPHLSREKQASFFNNHITSCINSMLSATKPFGRSAMPKGGLIDAKSVETGMLLEKTDKMAEV